MTTINNDDAYTLVKANPDVDEWWRYNNGFSYPGFFRGSRLDEYTAMPNSGSQLFAISSSSSAWEMSINGTSQGVASGNYNAGGALVIGNGSTGGGHPELHPPNGCAKRQELRPPAGDAETIMPLRRDR